MCKCKHAAWAAGCITIYAVFMIIIGACLAIMGLFTKAFALTDPASFYPLGPASTPAVAAVSSGSDWKMPQVDQRIR